MWTYLRNSFYPTSSNSGSSGSGGEGITDKELNTPPTRPGGKNSDPSEWMLVKPFWLRAGSLPTVDWTKKDAAGITRFVMTKTVEGYIRDLTAAVAAAVAPILLQGPTSGTLGSL